MTDETDYNPIIKLLDTGPMQELFRWDCDGKLVYVNPTLTDAVKGDLDARLQAVIVAHNELAARVTTLERQYAELLVFMPPRDLKRRTYSAEEFSAVEARFAFQTLQSLVDEIKKMFACANGYYGAYVFDPKQPLPDSADFQWLAYRYRTLGYITSNPDRPLERLRYALWKDLQTLCVRPNMQLYWRFAEAGRIQEEHTPIGRSVLWKIRTRVAIPGADWAKVREKIDLEEYVRID